MILFPLKHEGSTFLGECDQHSTLSLSLLAYWPAVVSTGWQITHPRCALLCGGQHASAAHCAGACGLQSISDALARPSSFPLARVASACDVAYSHLHGKQLLPTPQCPHRQLLAQHAWYDLHTALLPACHPMLPAFTCMPHNALSWQRSTG